MSLRRGSILTVLAFLTVGFLGAAAVAFYGNPLERPTSISGGTLLIETPTAIRLTVYESGIASISAKDIRQTNLSFQNFDADSLRLTRDGEQVPIYLTGEGDSAALFFYAEAVTNTLDAPAVYWLSNAAGLPMVERDAAPYAADAAPATHGWQHRVWEENTTFLAQASGSDNWLGPLLFAPQALDFELEAVSTDGGPGVLTIHLWSNNESATNPDHHAEVFLNGTKLDDYYWDGITEETITIDLPEGMLQDGSNVLRLNVPGDTGAAGEAIYVDWISLSYLSRLDATLGQLQFRTDAPVTSVKVPGRNALVFDVTNPAAPVVLTEPKVEEDVVAFAGNDSQEPRTYQVLDSDQAIVPLVGLVPDREALRSPELGADYIVIVANVEGFEEALQPLLARRREQGLRVMTVSVDQVYDEFAYGRQTPSAIRDFLQYSMENWQPPVPQYVLLVGDATYDIYGFSDGENRNLLPTYLVYTEFAGYVASDTWFTIFDSERPAPELAVGRFPAQNRGQLEAMVAKTVAYETMGGNGSEWTQRALLVADDEPRFDLASDTLDSSLVSTGYQTQRLYMTQNEDIRDAIISAMNKGVGVLNYVGHGGVEVWGDEQVLRADDADILENGERLPIFTTFTCLNGYFNHPTSNALAETLLWARDGGVVAAVAPSGRSFTSQQTPLADGFYGYLLSGEVDTVGEALRMTKVDASSDPDLREVIHTFNLLGDPALVFNLP